MPVIAARKKAIGNARINETGKIGKNNENSKNVKNGNKGENLKTNLA